MGVPAEYQKDCSTSGEQQALMNATLFVPDQNQIFVQASRQNLFPFLEDQQNDTCPCARHKFKVNVECVDGWNRRCEFRVQVQGSQTRFLRTYVRLASKMALASTVDRNVIRRP